MARFSSSRPSSLLAIVAACFTQASAFEIGVVRDRHPADGEVFQRAQGVDAVVRVGRHRPVAQQVTLYAYRTHKQGSVMEAESGTIVEGVTGQGRVNENAAVRRDAPRRLCLWILICNLT